MRNKFIILLVALCIDAHAEPLTDFEAIVDQCKKAFDARPTVEVAWTEAAKSWVKRVYAPIKITYDVQKTNSLVSPFSGYIEITEAVAAKVGLDEASAQALDVSINDEGMRTIRRLNYALRGGAWDIVDGRENFSTKLSANDPYGKPYSLQHTREKLLQKKGPLKSCIVGK